MSFKMQKNTDSMSGRAIVTIFNLSRESREALTVKNAKDSTPNLMLELTVGYENTQKIVVKGKAIVAHKWKAPEATSVFEVSDGLFEQASARIDKKYNKGEPYDKVIADLIDAIGLEKGRIDTVGKALPANLIINKAPKVKLDELGKLLGYRYSVELSKSNWIKKRKDGDTAGIVAAVILNSESGLLDKPYMKNDMLMVKCLFHPEIRLNDYIFVQSRSFSKPVLNRVIGIKSRGDTHGNNWTMDLTLSVQDTLQLMTDIYDELNTGSSNA